MRARGKYNLLASIEQATETRTAGGAVTKGWAEYTKAWVNVMPRTGRERFLAGRDASEIDCSIWMDYRASVTITAKMRVSVAGAVYNILAVLNREGRYRELELVCSQGVNNG